MTLTQEQEQNIRKLLRLSEPGLIHAKISLELHERTTKIYSDIIESLRLIKELRSSIEKQDSTKYNSSRYTQLKINQ